MTSDLTTDQLVDMMAALSARCGVSQLREAVPHIHDAAIARPIYTELLRIAKQMSEKHDFAYHKHKGDKI